MDVELLASLVLAIPALAAPLAVGCWNKKKTPAAKPKISKESGKTKVPASVQKSQQSQDGRPSPDVPKNNAAAVGAGKEAKDEKKTKKDQTPFDEEYPDIPEPTPSMKKKQEKQLEESRKLKIKKGFYQSKSDEDDTLEPIKSLKEEKSDEEFNRTSKKLSKKSKNRK